MNDINFQENGIFFRSVSDVLAQAQKQAKKAVDLAMVYAYYEIGRMIIEEKQLGKNRASYGKQLIRRLSEHLTSEFGKGY